MNSLDFKKNIKAQNGFIVHEIEAFSNGLNYDFNRLDKVINENDFHKIPYAEFVALITKNMREKKQIQEKIISQHKELEFLKNEFQIFLEKHEEIKVQNDK